MTNKTLAKYKIVKEPGAIFGAEITSEYLELQNNKIVNYVIQTGVGTKAKTTIKVKARLGATGKVVDIPFKEKIGQTTYNQVEKNGKSFEIGGTDGECGFIVIEVDADSLRGLYDRVALNVAAVSASVVPGSILQITFNPRYSE